MRTVLFVFIFSLLCNSGFSQARTSITDIRNIYDKKGDFYLDKKQYKKAIVYYNMAFKKDEKNYYSQLQKAKAFTALELYDQAAECYRIIFNTDLYIPNEHRYDYAFLLLKNKDIVGFEQRMKEYNKIVNDEITGYVSNNAVRAKMYKDSTILFLENESVLNSPFSETAPAIYKDRVIFASNRRNIAANNSYNYYNTYTATYTSSGQLGRLANFSNKLNSKQSERSYAFLDNAIYFTRSNSLNAGLKSYKANIPANAKAGVNVDEFKIGGFTSIGHITFNSKGTKMYFASEQSGGAGGTDIYSSELVGGKWNTPVNVSGANSAKDDMYPWVVNDTLLYFTSAGHNGLGGLDLFVLNLNDDNANPKNLGSKVNSPQDDYSLSFSPTGYTAYFCSNRPGGFGQEDIYRLHLLNVKVKHEAYKFRTRYKIEEGKINLYLSSGKDFNIATESGSGFNFGFQPEDNYKIVIQEENPLVSDVIYNTNLTPAQREKAFLKPKPLNRTNIPLEGGMRYQFTAGMKPMSTEYKEALNELSQSYSNSGSSAIDLTALAKELLLKDGGVYTIRFMKDNDNPTPYSSKNVTTLFANGQEVDITNDEFFIVLPLDIQTNFNIQTDIEHMQEAFNPKKVGALKVDDDPVIEEEPVEIQIGFPILVNTENENEVSSSEIDAKELTIIPGSMYILSLAKTDKETGEDIEIVIPLTKGVKYNLGSDPVDKTAYNKALNTMMAGQPKNTDPDAELIDISVLSNELDILPGEDILFTLIPAAKIASQNAGTRNVVTTLSVDGRKYYVTDRIKLKINLELDRTKKVNLQTDLDYVEDHFDLLTTSIKIDTLSLNEKFTVATTDGNVITDPVFDVIVINFDINEYAIRPDAKSILTNEVINVLQNDSRLYVTIKGYTDALGDADYNEKLSKNRAQSVKDFLSSNGIGESRIRTFSFGESLALDEGVDWEDLSEEELQKHRKVEIVIYLPK